MTNAHLCALSIVVPVRSIALEMDATSLTRASQKRKNVLSTANTSSSPLAEKTKCSALAQSMQMDALPRERANTTIQTTLAHLLVLSTVEKVSNTAVEMDAMFQTHASHRVKPALMPAHICHHTLAVKTKSSAKWVLICTDATWAHGACTKTPTLHPAPAK